MTSIYHKIAVAAASAALNLTLINVYTAQAASFTFTKIAETSIKPLTFSTPAINNNGIVSFVKGPSNLIISNGQDSQLIATNTFDSISDINEHEQVTYFGRTPGDIGIFIADRNLITTVADTSSLFSSFGRSSINNNGTVVFQAELDGGGEGIFIGNSTTPPNSVTTIADTSGVFTKFDEFPSINDKGTVAFIAQQNLGFGAFISSGGTITTIIEPGNLDILPSRPLSINNNNTVAFTGLRRENDIFVSGIYIADSTTPPNTVTTIVDSNSIFASFSYPVINDSGTVAFGAFLDTGDEGIFIGSDPISDKVIATGDSLFGSTVDSIFFFSRGLNNSGQIAFHARLADGRQVLVRANPKSVPEPTSVLGLMAFGAFGLGSLLLRKKKQLAKF